MRLKIAELMRQPTADHDLYWLQKALQAAVELELATLPPYLCGQWALKDQDSVPASLIADITIEEMGHMGLACNLLRATGQEPKIFDGYDEIKYPGPLPGGVRPRVDPDFFPADQDFEVILGFSNYNAFVKMCMQIEYPEDPVPRPKLFALDEETFPTIGEFYDAIVKALKDNDGTFPYNVDKQLENGRTGVFIIDGLTKATEAISRIQKEGEGSSRFPYVDAAGTRLAHFYSFGQIYFGKTYVFDKVKQTGDWTGDPPIGPVKPEDVYPMTPVPLGGYGRDVPSEVVDCDKSFTQMLQQLDAAWRDGDPESLRGAIRSMRTLQRQAIGLLKKQIARPEGGIYGPQFKKIAI